MTQVVIDMTMSLDLEKISSADGPLATHIRYHVLKS
jgi:hypothetical protein